MEEETTTTENAPEESGQATTSDGGNSEEATPEQLPEETTETPVEDNVSEVPEKFLNEDGTVAEDKLAKSYESAEKELSKTKQQLAEREALIASLSQEESNVGAPEMEQLPTDDTAAQDTAYMQKIVGNAMQPYMKPFIKNACSSKVEEMTAKHPDFAELAGEVNEELQKLPKATKQELGVDVIELAYKIARGNHVENISAKSFEEGRQQVSQKQQIKQELKGINRAEHSTTKKEDVLTREDINNMSPEEFTRRESEIDKLAAEGKIK